jgi:photosystem II stability/assembly factor-like uncharacterized protein
MKLASRSSARLFVSLLALGMLLPPLAADAQRAAPPKYKAIWEPVNYPGDFRLKSVYFVNGNVGWAVGSARNGKGGVILHTENGGEKWDIQLGDPNSQEPEIEKLHFLDARHGWAAQYGGKILRTSDGRNWEEAGSFPQFQWLTHLMFNSPQQGRAIGGSANESKIFSTQDGGRNWKQDFLCVAQVQIDGLTKRLGCSLFDMSFPTASVGYAVGGAYNGGFSIIAKTEDGGANWRTIFASTDIDSIQTVSFTDEKHGVIRSRGHKIFVTGDGGQSWRGIATSARGTIRFADPSVGWSCWERGCAVTADGGNTWTSRDLRLPATVKSFSAPRRDRVFLVGDHGMVYRYRVVPADYVAKGISSAPPAPGYGGELINSIEGIQARMRELKATASGVQGGSFAQDKAFMQALSTLETSAESFSRQAPAFAERHRNLNLLFVGTNMREDMNGRAAGVREGMLAVKDATDLKTLDAALQDLAAKLDDTSVAVASGFEHLAAEGAPVASGAVRNMAAPTSATAPASGQPPAGKNPAPGSAAGDEAAEQVKKALQRFLKF